jgi:hypothetical protein
MNWMRFFLVLVILFLAEGVLGEGMSTKEPRLKQLSQAYGFIIGQQASLEVIEQKFPNLAIDVKHAQFAFYSTALGDGAQGVKRELSILLGDKWLQYEKEISAQVKKLIEGQDLTRKQAIAFLEEVRERAKGKLPESILSTLLSAHPRFTENPGLELSAGWKQTFRTKGHPKAKGVDFSISFPASWSRREGYRPNIIQFFQSVVGHGPIMCNLMVKDIPLPAGYKPSNKEIKELFQPNELKDMVPEGGKFIDAKSIFLEGTPAGMLVSDQTVQRLDLTLEMRMTQFITIQEKSMIFIQFMVAKMDDSSESLDELQKKYLPTYKAIANTFILNDKYK